MGNFVFLWSGQALSLLGSQLVQFALVWWLTRTTGSATTLAIASLFALLPQVVIGPFAGVIVDRASRKKIMILADTGIALATLLLAILFFLGRASTGWIYLVLALRATGAAFHWPAMQATTTLMVPQKHLSRVGGWNQALLGISSIAIPPLGALAIETINIQGILAIDVLTALVAVGILIFLNIPQPDRPVPNQTQSKQSAWQDLLSGLKYILGWKGLLGLAVIGILINMLGRAAGSLMPLLVYEHFQGGALEFAWWQTSIGIGTLLGGITLGIWGGLKRRVVTQMIALILDGLVILLIGVSPTQAFPWAVIGIGLTGFLEAIVLGLSGAIAQAVIPPAIQGRIFGLLISLTQGLAPLGLLIAGPTADALGVPFWLVITGLMITLMGIFGLSVPAISRIEEHAPH